MSARNGHAPGRLFGVGVGPGDPELLTLKARRRIEEADVVAYTIARRGHGIARGAAAPFVGAGQVELALTYPVTTEDTEDYERLLERFYDDGAQQIAAHLDAGRDVALLCEGDPLFYGSYMYFHERLAPRYPTEVVPGVTAFSAAAAAAGTPLCKRDDVVMVLPGTLPEEELAARLADADAAVVMKLGRTWDRVRRATARAGVSERAVHVQRASAPEERVLPVDEVEGRVPYMSLVLVPTAAVATRARATGEVAVVGLGPGGPDWLTPEARAALAGADAVVGYGPYVARVPVRAGQERLASDNRVELDRARQALELAAAGRRVAVVSSGDPGIFAMAAAVFEAAEDDPALAEVPVRVVPGLSAMQAAAARAGAPLGHDFCVVSLSDIRKPWEVVERRIDAAASADLVMALYNPASRTRREQLVRALEVIGRHRSPDTPVVVARDVGGPQERVRVVELSHLDPEEVDMRTVLLVGSSQTRMLAGGRAYTPRSYPG